MFFSILIDLLALFISMYFFRAFLKYLVLPHIKRGFFEKLISSLSLVFSLFLVITLIFSIAYSLNSNYFSKFGRLIYQNGETVLDFFDCFYFSASTLLIGSFGDILPVGALKDLAIFEMFFGFLFLGMLIGLFAEGFGKLAFMHLDWSREHIIKKPPPVKKFEDKDNKSEVGI